MINSNFKGLCVLSLSLFAAGVLFSCEFYDGHKPIGKHPGMAPDVEFTALTDDNRIAWFHAQNLNSPMGVKEITGLENGDEILSIDYRPATGQLYALGSSSRIYIINEETGAATALGETSFSPTLEGDNPSLDFNPVVDRIRVVTESGQNLRLHPELGTVVAEDGDINGGNNPRIGAVAYSNSMAGTSSTELFVIDFEGDKLFLQDPPNDGGLKEIGDLGTDFKGTGNFDITPDKGTALAVTLDEDESRLYTISLSSGKAKWVGKFNLPVLGIAFKTNPVAFAATADNKLHRFNPMNPTENPVDLMGLMEGENIVGLDFRPLNGQLYAITNKSRLLTVNTSNGEVSAVGEGLVPEVNGTSFGFDFNPTVDRIRLVSNTGQNLRLHPDLGTVAVVDGDLNPGTPYVNAAAYTNSFAGATATVLYVLDSEADMLYRQDPPNDGVLVEIGSLGVDFDGKNGFDIGGSSNDAFALLKVGSGSAVYSIDLMSGEATKVADFDIDATAMSVGLGF